MAIILIANVTLSFVLGRYYLTLSSRTYIRINENGLEIHKWLARKNQFIKLKDIEKVCLIGEKIVIILTEYGLNKEFEIMLNLMYLKDVDILLNNFSKNNILAERF